MGYSDFNLTQTAQLQETLTSGKTKKNTKSPKKRGKLINLWRMSTDTRIVP